MKYKDNLTEFLLNVLKEEKVHPDESTSEMAIRLLGTLQLRNQGLEMRLNHYKKTLKYAFETLKTLEID